ncbi:MAG: pyruvate kinase [Candidatus Nomurabacteria bacterium]|jgi:pyruvate kinase|nr:pyruvate kinase [Candidatus Nomurabacteria bacterium]
MESNKTIKHTKILATIGPAVDSPEKIAALIDAGVDGCRMNFSHGTEEERLNQFKWIREYSAKIGRHIAIVQDLQGPKIRIGQLKDDMQYDIHTGDVIGLTYGIEHDGGNNLPSQYDISDKCGPGDVVYLFDGKIKTIVQNIEGKTVWVRAENDGCVISRKAINLPDMRGSRDDILTEKDLADIEWGLDKDFDYIALSFVHHADDVKMLRELLKSKGVDRPIITKLETKSGADPENLEAIVRASDGVMVARGDLAVEAGAEVVPVVQRQIVALCQKHCKFSIVATQMLASMIDNPEPTRAEASDIATAVIEGADVVMLSDETAMGKYPIEAVTAMREIILYAQNHLPVRPIYAREGSDKRRDSIAEAAVLLSERINASAIIVETQSGKMVRNVSVHRPQCPIICIATTDRVANQVELIYNTRSFYGDVGEGYVVAEKLFNSGLFGEAPVTVVMVRHNIDGAPIRTANTIQLYVLGDDK